MKTLCLVFAIIHYVISAFMTFSNIVSFDNIGFVPIFTAIFFGMWWTLFAVLCSIGDFKAEYVKNQYEDEDEEE